MNISPLYHVFFETSHVYPWDPKHPGIDHRGAAPEPSDLPKPSAEASKVLQRPSPARPVILQKPTHLRALGIEKCVDRMR